MNKTLAIVCKIMPPIVNGTPILIKNLFDEYPGKVEAIAGWEYGAKKDIFFKSPCKTHYLRFPNIVQRLFERRLVKLYCYYAYKFILNKLRMIQPSSVFIAITPDGIFSSAAIKACLKLNIPFYGHMHDLWEENALGYKGYLANKWEPVLFEKAVRIYAMTSTQLTFYEEKHGREIFLLPHTLSDKLMSTEINGVRKRLDGSLVNILYTGNISRHMNLDAIQEFVKAVDLLSDKFEVTMLTSFSENQLKSMEVYNERINYDWVSVRKAREIQRNADILFLPLSHKNASMLEVRTVYSTKTLDYLISGTPILVYAPRDSFHSISATEKGWGFVINVDSVEAIVEGINQLVNNKTVSEDIVKKAKKESKRRLSSKYAKALFQDVKMF